MPIETGTEAVSEMPVQPTGVFAFVTQPIVAEGLAKVLSDCPDLKFAGYSADPRTVIEEISGSGAGIFLLDQAYGLRIVFDLLSAVKRSTLLAQPVLWTREISAADRRLVLEAGARGILDRTLPVSTLVQCLRTVASGGLWTGDPDGGSGMEPRGGHRLTQREREVVALVRAGLKNREIGQRLAITPGTVKVHLMHVFEKTGARDRFELRMQAARLLEGEPPAAETEVLPGVMASGGST
jgi:two-component system nitrate/nitrite response regulator NarL